MKRFAKLTVLFWCFLCEAKEGKENKTLTVHAVANKAGLSEYRASYVTPGSSNTGCSGPGSGSANCQTTSTPTQHQEIVTRTLDVVNIVEGEGMRYVIFCLASWVGSNCAPLVEGDTFKAEIDKNTMWLIARKSGNQGKQVRMRNKVLDIRPVETAISGESPQQNRTSVEHAAGGNGNGIVQGDQSKPDSGRVSSSESSPSRIWSNGTLLDREATRMLLSLELASLPRVGHPDQTFAIRSDRFVYFVEMTNRGDQAFKTEDPEVLFAIDGDKLFMLADDEKEHEFRLVGKLSRSVKPSQP
jgi:hypothetical protein